jgi:hypothetical protein
VTYNGINPLKYTTAATDVNGAHVPENGGFGIHKIPVGRLAKL